MNSSKLQIKTKSILVFALGVVFALTAAVALVPAEANAAVNWVANPASCPQSDPVNFPGQNCAPNNMCGDSSGIAQCYDTGSIPAPAVNANSSVLYASALGGGYVINCFVASDAGVPYCDNSGAAWCNRDASCYGGGNNRLTTCLAGTWSYEGASSFTCGDCLTTHLDCTGDTKCEVQKNVTTYPTGGNNHYGTTCDAADVRCNTNYYDCDASGVTLGNGCEAYRAGACTGAGGLTGTWSCAVDAGGTCTDGGSNYTCTCVTPKCPFESATLCQYFSADPLLWGKQLGSGELIRMGNSIKEDAFVVENDGSIRMATTSAPGDTTGLLYNVGGDLYWDGTLVGAGASSSALDFQQVTDLGNITTNWIQFAGGTSTADFSITGNLNVTGDALFVNATGTNIAVAEQFMLGQYAVLPAAGYQSGAMVYNTTEAVPYFWDGSSWVAFATGTGSGTSGWLLTSNVGTNSSTQFIGTTDNQSLVFRTNNIQRMVLDNEGRLGVGVINPEAGLAVFSSDGPFATFAGIDDTKGLRMGSDMFGGDLGLAYDNGNHLLISTYFNDSGNNYDHVFVGDRHFTVRQASGYVGVNTIDPFARFHTVDDGSFLGAFTNSTLSEGIMFVNDNLGDEIGMSDIRSDGIIAAVSKADTSAFYYANRVMIARTDVQGLGINTDPARSLHVYTSYGETALARMENDYGSFEMHNVNTNPNGFATGTIGSLAVDSTSGRLYIKEIGNGTNTGWVAFATGTGGGGSGNLQAVTDIGNTTTNWIEFAGGTSTANFAVNRPNTSALFTVRSGNDDAFFDLIGSGGATALRMSSNGGGNFATFEIASDGSFNMLAGGTNVIWADALTGNVGIGNSNPTDLLHVYSDTRTSALRVSSGDGQNAYVIVDFDRAMGGEGSLSFRENGVQRGVINSGWNGYDFFAVAADGGYALDLITTGVPRVHITNATGRVGIGTITPSTRLHVNSGAASTTAIATYQNNVGDYQQFLVTSNPHGLVTGSRGDLAIDSANGRLYIKETGNGTNTGWVAFATGTGGGGSGDLQAVTDIGNITTNWIEFAGGTSTNDFAIIRPNAETHLSVISGDSDSILILEGNAGATELRMTSDGGSDWASVLVDGDGSFNLHTSGSGRNMYINSATGYIGVNTIVPDARLTVSGEGATANSALSIENFSSNLADFPGITFKAAQGDSTVVEAVDSGKTLGAMVFQGHNGTDYNVGSVILSRAVGDWDGVNNGANLIFYTTDLGGGFLRQRVSIDSEGLYIGNHVGHTALAPLDIDVEGGIGNPAIALNNSGTGFMIYNSDADPEGYITGSVGDLAVDSVSGVMYIKETGDATNTGWSAFATGTAGALDLQQVTDNGNITTNWIQFAGGTSTGNIIPGANNTYALGGSARRWSDVWASNVHIGTSTWDLAQAANGALTVTRAGGSEAMRILTNGNVGIGTELPGAYKLNVAGSSYFSVGEDASVFEVYNSPKTNSHIRVNGDLDYVVLQENSGNVGIGVGVPDRLFHARINDSVTNNITYAARFSHTTDGLATSHFGTGLEFELQNNAGINKIAGTLDSRWNNASNNVEKSEMMFRTVVNGALDERMRIDANGNVSVGFAGTTVGYRFRVDGNSLFDVGGELNSFIVRNMTFATPENQIRVDSLNHNTLLQEEAGNVGIGESAPAYKLHINGGVTAGNNLFRAEAGLNGGYVSMYVSSTDDRNSVIGFQRNLEFFSQNQMIMTLTNSQRVGVGITNPAYRLDVSGDARLTAQFMLGQYALNPASGLQSGAMIYNTASSTPFYWNGTAWKALASQDLITLDRAYDAGGLVPGGGRQISVDSGAVELTGAGDGTSLYIENTGLGQGITMYQSGDGDGMYIRQVNGRGFVLENNTGNDGMVVSTADSGTGIQVSNEGSGSNGLRIDNDTDGSGIYIEDTLGKASINISKPSGSGDLFHLSNAGTGDVFDMINSSSGIVFKLSNTGTGDSLYIMDEALDATPFVLTARGDLGIGTATPDARLEITGNNSLADVTLLKFQATNNSDIQSEIFFSGGGNATNWNVNSSGNGGALIIKDGTSEIGKFLNNGFIINDGGLANVDFRVESDTDTHALFVDATNGNVGFNQSTPLAKLHVGNTTAGSSADYNYMRLQGSGDVDHRLYIPTGSNLMIWNYNVTGNGGAIEFRDYNTRVGLFTNSGLVINEGGVTGVGLRVEGDTNANLLYTDAANDRVGIGTNSPAVRFHATQSANTVAAFDRTTSDGVIVSLRQDGTEEGTISVSGTTVSYNAFTGSHYTWTDEVIEKGMLVSLTGENRNLHNNPQSEIVYGVAKTAVVNDSRVMGAYLALQESNKAYDESNPHLVMAVGNGEMWVADNGENINIGDYLISSDVVGHAQKDTGEFIVSHIIAKAAESVNWSNVTNEFNGVKHKKISVFFESFDKSNMQSSVAGTSLQGGDSNLEVVDLAVSNAIFEGNVTVMGHVTLSRDAVGQAMILTGENKVTVTFEVPYDELPIVTVTPYGAKRMDYGVENVSLTGFDIVIDPIQYKDILFNWHAFGNREAKVFVSNGTTLDIEMTDMGSSKLESDINSYGQAFVSEPVEEVGVTESESTEPATSTEPTSEPETEPESEQTSEISTEPEPASVTEPESEQVTETVIETVE